MFVESTAELAIPARFVADAMTAVPARELAALATAATSSGEALLERSGLLRLDEANQCHFGAQLGRPVNHGVMMTMQLRWWNDRSRSLTPGFIGQIGIRRVADALSELSVSGEYHPRAHLYELVDRAFLSRMATTVVSSFAEQLRTKITESVAINAA